MVRGRGPGGVRLLVACGAEHLAALVARRRRHRRTPEELWLGQIYAALRLVGREPAEEELREVGGLAAQRIDRAVRGGRSPRPGEALGTG
ncbi:hypothetical protein GCM10009759_55870 [Kitasatospora saccharophila]|uniref:MftR C-terminal domain-containing protein n=1 Tax=Kitasatospora saccharophila TaxID=407973 RepID=A0ABN2XK95_9ACTN